MNFKNFIFFFFTLNILSIAQTKYFVKFKNNISKSESINELSNILSYRSNVKSLQKIQSSTFKSFTDKFSLLDNSLDKYFVVEISNSEDSVISILKSNPDIEFVQKSITYKIDYVPDDSLYSDQWGLQNIKAETAWDLIPTDSKKIILALIDTGIDYLHPDLKNHIYKNPGEIGIDKNGNDKSTNGIDDDENGFIDDYRGWDFVNKINIYYAVPKDDFTTWDNDPSDENGHGTNVAGVIGAEHNLIGIAGVNPNIEIMNLRAFDKNGNGEEDDAASAILYAVKMGAKIINMSWGDTEFSQLLKDVIDFAYSQGVIFVASAGNSESNLPHYPSGFSNVISVGAIQENEALAGFSNYGSTLDLVAPGSQIITTNLDNSYKVVSGTSISAPFVSAAASLILSFNSYSNEEVKQVMKTTCKDLGEHGWDETYGAGSLNLEKAVRLSIPSIIKINYPQNDFYTSQNNLALNISCVSPYFKNYEIQYGIGYNPTEWNNLEIQNNQYQLLNEDVYDFDLSKMSDTTYTIRLKVNTVDNNILEERSSFTIDRTAPIVKSYSMFPAMLNNLETVQASVYTNEKTTAQLYYRPTNSSEDFKSIYMDNYSQDIKVVSEKHFGVLTYNDIRNGIDFEYYILLKNQAGISTILKDGEKYFYTENTIVRYNEGPTSRKTYTLPTGRIYSDIVNFSGVDNKFVLLNENETSADVSIYEFNNLEFTKINSMNNRIPVSVGDFNNDGKTDILSLFVKNGYIESQTQSSKLTFENVFKDTSGSFWPALAEDIDNDNKTEIIAMSSDTTIAIWEVESNFNLQKETDLKIFNTDESNSGNSIFRNNQVLVDDFDNDGKKEIVAADNFGRLLFYEIESNRNYKNDFIVETYYSAESNTQIAKGDFDGDGNIDIGVISEFEDNIYITPVIYTAVISFVPTIQHFLFQNMLLSTEKKFISSFDKSYSAIRFSDFNNDSKDELIIFSNPNAYIFDYDPNKTKLIYYLTDVNSQSIFIGDLDGNNLKEISIPNSNFTKFRELDSGSTQLIAPVITDSYSIDSTHNYFSWQNDNNFKTKVYKWGELAYDSTFANYFIDNVKSNTITSYYIEFYDQFNNVISSKSNLISIYSHQPGRFDSIEILNNKSLKMTFTLPINVDNLRIENLKIDENNPSSIAESSENSLILSTQDILLNGEHSFSFKNVRDKYNTPIKDSTITFNVDFNNDDTTNLFITSYKILNNYNLKITYNFNLDTLTSINTNNYIISPNNKILQVIFDNKSNNTVLVTTEKPFGSIGKEYILTVKNVHSSIESGYIPINENVGNQIILTGNAENLKDIFVYPNPINVNENSKLTFANLTQFAEIYIFTIDGKFVTKLNEDDGNGGFDWNLLDDNGKKINSGIYIYKVIARDSEGNKIDEKINKFAVIR